MERQPAYRRIAEHLDGAIRDERIVTGAIIKIAEVAKIFGSSRSPVKQAFEILEAQGSVRPHDGQGFVVGNDSEPFRFTLTADHLTLGDGEIDANQSALDELYFRIERELILHSMSGHLRVNELALARHFGIGRTVARDLIFRANKLGIVARGNGGHWQIVGLDVERCRNLYDLRRILEPIALEAAASLIPRSELEDMRGRLGEAIAVSPALDIVDLDRLENDLHQRCLGYCPNPEIIEALSRTAPTYICGKYLQVTLSDNPTIETFMHDHNEIITLILDGRSTDAGERLREHLVLSCGQIVERLTEYLETKTTPDVEYIW